MTVRTIYRLQDAFECDLAGTDDGWAMAAVCMDDVDEGFIANMDADREWEDIKATLLPGVTYQDWIDAYLAMRPTLHLVESRSGDVRIAHTSSAEQFLGLRRSIRARLRLGRARRRHMEPEAPQRRGGQDPGVRLHGPPGPIHRTR